MNKNKESRPTAHRLLAGALLTALCGLAQADEPIKIGLLMSYSGTYAAPSEATTNGLKLALEQYGDQLGGRPV